MKKYSVILLALLLCGCSSASKNISKSISNDVLVTEETESTNYFGGVGEIQYRERVNGRNALFDDENVYITFKDKGLLKLDNENNLSKLSNAFTNGSEYFVFNNKLYRYYNELDVNNFPTIDRGHIKDMESGEIVSDNSRIYHVRVINDNYIKVEEHHQAYILDKNFDIICMYDDVGKLPWGTLYEDKYYYVNNLKQLVNIDIKTKEREVVISDIECFLGGAYEDYIFISGEGKLYRYNLVNKELISIADDVIMFSVYDGYIYADAGTGKNKRIMDIDGNVIKDFTEYTNMECCDSFKKVGNKIYCTYEDGIAVMKEDGTDYKCIPWNEEERECP